MEQIYVQTEDLSVGYHKKVLLSDIALKVNKGEILVFCLLYTSDAADE